MRTDRGGAPRATVLGAWIGLALGAARLGFLHAMDRLWRDHPAETVLRRLAAHAPRTLFVALACGLAAAALLGRARRTVAARFGAAALMLVALSGIGWDDAFHVPDARTTRGIAVLAAMFVAAVLAASLLATDSIRKLRFFASATSAGIALFAALALALGLRWAARPSEEMVLRSLALDFTRAAERVDTVRARPGAPPRAEAMNPGVDTTLDGGEQSALVLPPPAEVRLTVDEQGGPFRFVAAAGIDRSAEAALASVERPVSIRFRATKNGAVAFDLTVECTREGAGAARAWRRFEVPVDTGDVLALSTEVEGAELAPEGPLTAGFGICRLERLARRPRVRSSPDAPSIVLVVVDTLRADRMSLYGYERPTTPHVDALAARGTAFDEACSTSSWTAPSTASILTGLLPEAHGVRDYADCSLDASLVTLAEVLQARGYSTAGFSCNPLIVAERDFDQGFERFSGPHGELRASRFVVQQALEWMEGFAGLRFFLYLHLVDPHVPHRPLPELRTRFAGDPPADFPAGGDLDYYLRIQAARRKGEPLESVVPAEHLRYVSRLYDACVATADDWIGQVVDRLDALGIAGETVVAITSDHGEELGEHGMLGHSFTLHRELVRVPLVLAGPGIPANHRVSQLVSNRWLAPTLARFGGALLGTAPDAADLFDPPQRPIAFSTELGWTDGGENRSIQGCRSGDYAMHLELGGEPRVLGLYDDSRDPAERNDLSAAEPDRVRALTESILQLRREHAERAPRSRGRRIGADTLEALRALGYVGEGELTEGDR